MHELAGFLGKVIGLCAGIYFLYRTYLSKKKAVETPAGKILLIDETKIAEIYCESTWTWG